MTTKPKSRAECRSDEEWQFVRWLHEAVRHDLVSNWIYEPKTFELFRERTVQETVVLKTKVKIEHRHLHRAEGYTPDVMVEFTAVGARKLFPAFRMSMLASEWKGGATVVWVDVKGGFNPYQSDERYFSIFRKAMFAAHGIWVAKVIPFHGKNKGLFAETFAPEEYRWMKGRKVPTLTSCGRACRSVEEFVK